MNGRNRSFPAWFALVALILLPALVKKPLENYSDRSLADWSLRGEQAAVDALAFSLDGKSLLSGDTKGNLSLWDCSTRKVISEGKAGSPIKSIAPYPHGDWFMVCGGESIARFTPSKSPALDNISKQENFDCNLIRFSPDGRWYSIVFRIGDTDRFYCRTPSPDSQYSVFPEKRMLWRAIALSPRPDTVAVRSENQVEIVNIENRQVLKRLDFGQAVMDLQYAADGRLFGAYGFSDGKVDAAYGWFDPSMNSLHRVGKRLTIPVSRLALSAKGDRIAVSGSIGFIRVYDIASEREIFRFNAHSPIHALALSPDGLLLACSGSANGSIRLWDLSKHKPKPN